MFKDCQIFILCRVPFPDVSLPGMKKNRRYFKANSSNENEFINSIQCMTSTSLYINLLPQYKLIEMTLNIDFNKN